MRTTIPALVITIGCGHAAPSTPRAAATLPPGTVAAVGTRTLSLDALRRHVVMEARIQHGSADACHEPAAPCEPPRSLVMRTLETRVDQLVLNEHAAQSGIVVDASEVERVIASVAKRQGTSTDEVFARLRQEGIEPNEYRQWIAERLLRSESWARGPGKEGPLPGLATEADRKATLERAYAEWQRDPANRYVTLRTLAFPVGENEAYVTESLRALQERASRGEDFCQLIAQYTTTNCTAMYPVPVRLLMPELRSVVARIDPMHVHGPMRIGEAMLLVQMVERPAPPPLDHVRRTVWTTAVTKIEEDAIAKWLQRLRGGYSVQIAAFDTTPLERDVTEIRRAQRTTDVRARADLARAAVLEFLRSKRQ